MIEFDTRGHGAVPFWFWNGDQQEAELTRQLERAAAGGLKGMAIHARRGNRTAYLSGRWMALTRHACEEALRLGLDIWLYDEEGFPSGTVGHRLQQDEPFYQQKLLRYGYMPGSKIGALENLVAAYDARTFERVVPRSRARQRVVPRSRARQRVEWRGEACPEDPPAGAGGYESDDRELLAFWMVCLPRYVDTLKRETVDRFIDMTHRRYYEALQPYFGKPITCIYTDDLNSNLDRGPSLPYTEALPAIFEKRLGYDLLDHLPALIENVAGCEKVRLDFRGLVLDLFLTQFVAPMYQWCEAHGVRLTGHLSGDEGGLDKAAHRFGSAMAFYEHEHIPGVDDFLCAVPSGCYLDQLRNPKHHCPVVLFKQVSSVANQLKGGACSCESLTFLGWGASVWGQSALLNYELALGVNLITHHDFSYATGGPAKRDCPPSYFFQQPYWPEYKRFHDAIARSTQLLKRGTYDASTLVIHPMSSCWIAMDGQKISIAEPFATLTQATRPDPLGLEESLAAVSHELLKMQVGFEYGDEGLLARHGTVSGAQLRVGAMAYRTVIIPEVSNLMSTTVALLKAFQAAGGQLIAFRPSAGCLVDGATPPQPVFGDCLHPLVLDAPEALREQDLQPTLDLRLAEPGAPVICHTRRVDGHREHFVCNLSGRPQSVGWAGRQIAYDPVENGCLEVDDATLILPPFHAIHLLPEAPAEVPVQPLRQSLFGPEPKAMVQIPAASWRITAEQPNLMLVDWCSLPDGRTVYHTDSEIPGEVHALSAVVDIPEPHTITSIAGESVTLDTLRINGVRPPPAAASHPFSPDLVVVDAAGLFVPGINTLEFARLSGEVLFEPFYLAGDFGVDLVATEHGMRPRPAPLCPALGDLVEQGLPFYWGGVRYETEVAGEPAADWLDCGAVDGVLTLHVNGIAAGCRYRAPYRFRIADLLEKGTNRLVLTLYNTAQNLYGPHRHEQRVALHACDRRGTGHDDYYLAKFGVHGPVIFLHSRP